MHLPAFRQNAGWLLALSLILALGTVKSVAAENIVALRTIVGDLIRDEKYVEAEVRAKRWLELAEQSSSQNLDVADALEALVRIYAGLRRYEDAEAFWRRCVELRVNTLGAKHALIAKTIDLMMGIYIDQGRNAEARKLWREGLAAFQAKPPPAAMAGHSNPPDLTARQVPDLIAQGRFAEAEAALRRNGDIIALGAFLLDRGRQGEAAALHRQLLESAPTAERAINIAAVYRQHGLAREEQEFLHRAMAIQERTLGPEHGDLIASLTALALSFERQGESAKAYSALKRAVTIANGIRGKQTLTSSTASALRLRQPYLDFLRVASRLAQDRPERIGEITGEAFEAGQLVAETALNSIVVRMGIRLSQSNGSLAQLIRRRQDSEREWQKLDKLLISAVTSAEPNNGTVQKDALRLQIAAVEKQLSTTNDQLRKTFPHYFDFAMPPPLALADAQALLKGDEALVQFVVIGQHSYVWVVTKFNAKWVSVPGTTAEIETTVAALRCGLDYWGAWKSPSSRCAGLLHRSYTDADYVLPNPLPFDLTRAYELYKLLFGQFEDTIANKQLLIIPSGPLSSLPFHVLVTHKPAAEIPGDWLGYIDTAWLFKRHAITVLPSVASLKTFREYAKRSAARNAYIAFANPVLGGALDKRALQKRMCLTDRPTLRKVADAVVRGTIARYFRGDLADVEAVRTLEPLVETADEVCAVAQKLSAAPADVFLADRATESALKSLSRSGALESYRIVHFATHGLLPTESEILAHGPSEPALVLTPPARASPDDDGLLTAGEIAELRLNAEWVILSACNTAAGDRPGADALTGLAQAFFYAGTRALLVSHWAVDSDATVSLITQTFDNLEANASIGRAEALREAMSTMTHSEKGPAVHPAYWAPFVVIGDGAGR